MSTVLKNGKIYQSFGDDTSGYIAEVDNHQTIIKKLETTYKDYWEAEEALIAFAMSGIYSKQ